MDTFAVSLTRSAVLDGRLILKLPPVSILGVIKKNDDVNSAGDEIVPRSPSPHRLFQPFYVWRMILSILPYLRWVVGSVGRKFAIPSALVGD